MPEALNSAVSPAPVCNPPLRNAPPAADRVAVPPIVPPVCVITPCAVAFCAPVASRPALIARESTKTTPPEAAETSRVEPFTTVLRAA